MAVTTSNAIDTLADPGILHSVLNTRLSEFTAFADAVERRLEHL